MDSGAGKMTVEDIMTGSVITVTPDTGFQELLSTMAEHRVSGVPVVGDGGRLVGIVSEADLLREGEGDRGRTRALGWLLNPGKTEEARTRGHTARSIMTTPVVTVRPETSIWLAIRVLREAGVKRLPVVDEEDRVVGIVSRADLIRGFIRSDEQIAEEVRGIIRKVLATDLNEVDVKVEQGRVSLSGSVDHAAQLEVLVDLAHHVPGVLDLTHDVEVAGERGRGTPFAPIQPPGEAGPRADL
jgi:CBS domain-containing protein